MYLLNDSTSLYEDKLIQKAIHCLEARLTHTGEIMASSKIAIDYCRLQLASETHEVFGVLFLNTKHALIAFEKLFFGTINKATIYPRVILKRALMLNASVVILTHNHPSQGITPSLEDITLTKELQKLLTMIDVSVLDHIIVSCSGSYSMAEHSLLGE